MNITREIPADIHKQLRQTIEAAYGIEDNCLEDLGCVECCPIFAMTQEYLHLQKDLPPQTTTTMATLLLPPNWMKPAVRLWYKWTGPGRGDAALWVRVGVLRPRPCLSPALWLGHLHLHGGGEVRGVLHLQLGPGPEAVAEGCTLEGQNYTTHGSWQKSKTMKISRLQDLKKMGLKHRVSKTKSSLLVQRELSDWAAKQWKSAVKIQNHENQPFAKLKKNGIKAPSFKNKIS